MSYFAAFGVHGQDEPVDADDIASNTGYAAFVEWAAELDADEYPELSYLAENGEVYAEDGDDKDVLADLEHELRRALREKPDDPSPNVLSVGVRLLLVVEQRPDGAFYLVISDGTEA